MTSKKALVVWILVIFAFLATLSTFHAWILWQTEGVNMVAFLSFQIEVTIYFVATLTLAFFFIGTVCYVIFSKESLDLQFYQLSKDFREKLDTKSEEIKDSTEEALTKLGLREFQLKENIKALQKRFGELDSDMKQNLINSEKTLKTTQNKLTKIERKIDKIRIAQKELPQLKTKLRALETVEKDLRNIQNLVEQIDSVPKSYMTSTDHIKSFEGILLKRATVRQLRLNGIEKIEELIFKSPVEIALTRAMTENEAKSLQSVIKLLMIPGVQHDDAVLLLKSGINSRQELALQDVFNLGAKVSKTAELYIKEGKIRETEKPTLEEIGSWIKWAKVQ